MALVKATKSTNADDSVKWMTGRQSVGERGKRKRVQTFLCNYKSKVEQTC